MVFDDSQRESWGDGIDHGDIPTARQLAFAQSLGVRITANLTRFQLSKLIDAEKRKPEGPPTQLQRQLAASLCIALPELKTRRQATDFLYEYIAARCWVYSVIRHSVRADWGRYDESGLAEATIAKMATAIAANPELMAYIRKRSEGNSYAGGDNWYRIAGKANQSAAYRFVRDFELSEDELRMINVGSQSGNRKQRKTGAGARASRKSPTGCAVFLALVPVVMTVLACWLYVFLSDTITR